MALLLAGGARDPNLRALARRARLTGIPVVAALTAPGQVPRICGDPERGELRLEGKALRAGDGPKGSPDRPRRRVNQSPVSAPRAEVEDDQPVEAQASAAPARTGKPAENGASAGDAGGTDAVWPVSAAFLRGDVFGQGAPNGGRAPYDPAPPGADMQAHADYPALQAGFLAILRGWLAGTPGVAHFNHDPFGRSRSVNKFAALHAAARAGLSVPVTRSGNDPGVFLEMLESGATVQKPFRGGNYCCPLTEDLVRSHMARRSGLPMVTAQPRLVAPELRVFRAGNRLLGYTVLSPALDYRTDGAARVLPCDVPDDLAGPLMALTDAMGLDWCASDFKRCPRTGHLLYLETNANPMFAAFDRAGSGDLCDAILAALGLGRPAQRRHGTTGHGIRNRAVAAGPCRAGPASSQSAAPAV